MEMIILYLNHNLINHLRFSWTKWDPNSHSSHPQKPIKQIHIQYYKISQPNQITYSSFLFVWSSTYVSQIHTSIQNCCYLVFNCMTAIIVLFRHHKSWSCSLECSITLSTNAARLLLVIKRAIFILLYIPILQINTQSQSECVGFGQH